MNTSSQKQHAAASGEPGTSVLRDLTAGTAFGIRPGEGALAWLFFLDFVILATVHFAAKSV